MSHVKYILFKGDMFHSNHSKWWRKGGNEFKRYRKGKRVVCNWNLDI